MYGVTVTQCNTAAQPREPTRCHFECARRGDGAGRVPNMPSSTSPNVCTVVRTHLHISDCESARTQENAGARERRRRPARLGMPVLPVRTRSRCSCVVCLILTDAIFPPHLHGSCGYDDYRVKATILAARNLPKPKSEARYVRIVSTAVKVMASPVSQQFR